MREREEERLVDHFLLEELPHDRLTPPINTHAYDVESDGGPLIVNTLRIATAPSHSSLHVVTLYSYSRLLSFLSPQSVRVSE